MSRIIVRDNSNGDIPFPEDWNIIPIFPRSKRPVGKWKKFQREYYPQEQLSNHTGNYGVIYGEISCNLLIIDPDFKNNNKNYFKIILARFEEKYPDLADTYIVSTPHGYHLYYKTEGFSVNRKVNKNVIYQQRKEKEEGQGLHEVRVFIGSSKTNFAKYLSGVDFLGNNGYALIPPSVSEDGLIYEPYNNKSIKSISEEDFKRIKSFFLLEKQKRVRRGFADILNGKINIDIISSETGVEKFQYFKFLFRECYHQCGLVPADIYEFLARNQPSFDQEITEQQLQHHSYLENPLTTEKYRNFFPKYATNTQTTNTDTEGSVSDPQKKKKKLLPIWLVIGNEVLEKFNLITLEDNRVLMVFDSNHYTTNLTSVIIYITKRLKELKTSGYRRYKIDILEHIKDATLIPRDHFCYEWVVNFPNGQYDLLEDIFIPETNPNSPYVFYEVSQEYKTDRTYKCRRFKKALRAWLRKKDQVVRVRDVFEMIGYCLTPVVGLKLAALNYGLKDSGKTQFTNILCELITKNNRAGLSLQQLGKRFGTHGLEFKILNVNADISSSKILSMGPFKALTGDDTDIHAEIKGGAHYTFKNSTKFWFNANKIPSVSDSNDDAFFERFFLIPFPNTFNRESKNAVVEFYKTITENPDEMQGIIHECIKGIKRMLLRGGLRKEVMENTKHVWNYNSNPVYAFVYDYCEKELGSIILTNDFYEQFSLYSAELGKEGMSRQQINKELEKLGIFKKRENRPNQNYYYEGIRWKDGSLLDL